MIISLPAIKRLRLSRQITLVWKENVLESGTTGVPFSVFVLPSAVWVWQVKLFKVNTGSVPQKIPSEAARPRPDQQHCWTGGSRLAWCRPHQVTASRGLPSRVRPPWRVGLSPVLSGPFLVWLGMTHCYHSSLPGLDIMIHRFLNLTSRWWQEVGSERKQVGSRRQQY